MSWFTNWLVNRALKLPSNLNSGGDLIRCYKKPLFEAIDKLDSVLDADAITNKLLSYLSLEGTAKAIAHLFLMGVVEKGIDLADGKIDRFQSYLKNFILTCK